LELAANKIGGEGARHLAEMLTKNEVRKKILFQFRYL